MSHVCAQIAALAALRNALDSSQTGEAPCPNDFVATWLPGLLQQMQVRPAASMTWWHGG